MSRSTEIPNSQPSSPAVSPPNDLDHNDDRQGTTKPQVAPASSATQDLNVKASSGTAVASARAHSTRLSSDIPSSHKANIHSPFRRPLLHGTRSAYAPLPSNPASREYILQRDRSRLPLTAQNTSTNHPDYHRAQVVMVTNMATFTKQDLVSKLEELQNLLPKEEPASSTTFPPSTHANTTSSSYKTSPTSQPSTDLTPAQTRTLVEARRILDKHVAMLSRYNQIKDAGMAMLGILAEQKGATVREIMAERGVDEAD